MNEKELKDVLSGIFKETGATTPMPGFRLPLDSEKNQAQHIH